MSKMKTNAKSFDEAEPLCELPAATDGYCRFGLAIKRQENKAEVKGVSLRPDLTFDSLAQDSGAIRRAWPYQLCGLSTT